MKKIFFSWQSDIKDNRNILEDCLKNAVASVDGFEIDSATRDTMGSPNINENILQKINDADIFFGDVSIINPTDTTARKCPNPNVLFELGYALKALGESQLILIADSLTTPKIADLPFDIRNRRLIYKRVENDNKKIITGEISYILKQYENRPVVQTPYVYFALASSSTDGTTTFNIYNNDSIPYFLESIELPGVNIVINEDLPPNSDNKTVKFTIPNYPFSSSFEFISYVISHREVRYRVFQKIILENRNDNKFNLQLLEKRPTKAIKIS